MGGLCLFIGGALFGSVGIKALKSDKAIKAYTQITAAALRAKDSAEVTAQSVKEIADDILADAKEINAAKAAEAENAALETA